MKTRGRVHSSPLMVAWLPLILLSVAIAQSGPLTEPFPGELDLSSLDGRNGLVVGGTPDIFGGNIGSAVSAAGDVNGDGIDDFIVVSDFEDDCRLECRPRPSFVVFGREAGAGGFTHFFSVEDVDGRNGFGVFGDRYGTQPLIAPAGDVNADGIDDVLARCWSPREDEYVTFVVFGRDVGSEGPFAPLIQSEDIDGSNGFRLAFDSPTDAAVQTVSGVGDLNGDGIDDLAVALPLEHSGGRPQLGSTFVVFGRDASVGTPFPEQLDLATLDGTDGFRFDGTQDWERSGMVIAPAGDLNGDGLDDMMIGAPDARPGGEPGGSVYVLFGRQAATTGPFPPRISVAWIDTTNGFIISGDGDRMTIGQSAAHAGDVNADGHDDVIIGAPEACPCRTWPGRDPAGAAFVVYGRDTASAQRFPYRLRVSSLAETTGFRLEGRDLRDRAGFSVGGGGDINGDGIDDLVIGASQFERYGWSAAGSGYVVFGRDVARDGPFPAVFQLSSLRGLLSPNGFRADGVQGFDTARAIAIVGDLNADGIDDVAIGAKHARDSPRTYVGAAYVIYGRDLNRCLADIDGDGELTLFDFLEFQNLFDAGNPIADFDGDGDFTIFDFLAFQNAFDAGCP